MSGGYSILDFPPAAGHEALKPAIHSVENQLVAFLPNLRRFAMSLCRDRALADDLVQGACERALANSARFQPGTRFDAWMFTILRNLWIDHARRRQTAGIHEDVDDRADLIGATGEEPYHALELKAVADAIDKLSEDQREVLLLVCVEGFSYQETAEIIGAPIGTVMSRLARARIALSRMTGIVGAPARSGDDRAE